jgi:hypothetical protein
MTLLAPGYQLGSSTSRTGSISRIAEYLLLRDANAQTAGSNLSLLCSFYQERRTADLGDVQSLYFPSHVLVAGW